jgi:hypothetical protein
MCDYTNLTNPHVVRTNSRPCDKICWEHKEELRLVHHRTEGVGASVCWELLFMVTVVVHAALICPCIASLPPMSRHISELRQASFVRQTVILLCLFICAFTFHYYFLLKLRQLNHIHYMKWLKKRSHLSMRSESGKFRCVVSQIRCLQVEFIVLLVVVWKHWSTAPCRVAGISAIQFIQRPVICG